MALLCYPTVYYEVSGLFLLSVLVPYCYTLYYSTITISRKKRDFHYWDRMAQIMNFFHDRDFFDPTSAATLPPALTARNRITAIYSYLQQTILERLKKFHISDKITVYTVIVFKLFFWQLLLQLLGEERG